MMDAFSLLSLCRSCSAAVYTTRPPSPRYAESVARLLAGTAATESNLRHRRQHGLDYSVSRGAWGLWQMEPGALAEVLDYLADRPALARNCAVWLLEQPEAKWPWPDGADGSGALRLLYSWDRFACLMARVYYVRIPAPIPRTLEAQGGYWKTHYNTYEGRGEVAKYIGDFKRLIEPAMAEA